jgi:hypothetical protein
VNSTITIPARVVPLLRRGLLAELGRNAALIDRASLEPDSDHNRDLFIGPLEALDANWRLLNEIGWAEHPCQREVHVDHATHVWALSTALHARLHAERDHLESRPPRRERRKARRNIRRITRYLTRNWLMFKTPPLRRARQWIRGATRTLITRLNPRRGRLRHSQGAAHHLPAKTLNQLHPIHH